MTLLLWLTILAVAVLVGLIAGYLLAIGAALRRAHRDLVRLAEGLETIEGNTRPLAGRLGSINAAAGQLLEGLRRVDGHLKGVAVLLRM